MKTKISIWKKQWRIVLTNKYSKIMKYEIDEDEGEKMKWRRMRKKEDSNICNEDNNNIIWKEEDKW